MDDTVGDKFNIHTETKESDDDQVEPLRNNEPHRNNRRIRVSGPCKKNSPMVSS